MGREQGKSHLSMKSVDFIAAFSVTLDTYGEQGLVMEWAAVLVLLHEPTKPEAVLFLAPFEGCLLIPVCSLCP